MASELEEKNKALVLRAFDFNKRDYATAEQFWSPQYIQHSAHIAPGREGLFDLIESLPPTLSTRRERSWRRAISSLCTDGFRHSAPLQIGSLPTSYTSRTDYSSNLGM